ncbi:peptidase S8 family protein [Nitzschia inconspicua]|uniref:Peptidase S8 family protein n=1 Tax=Nitzschia inconspicua TaxID=303405 RepID=A0A9K3PNB4_9STRA|nr:peptidase S8 family protein [Nitzschia inconspicua]
MSIKGFVVLPALFALFHSSIVLATETRPGAVIKTSLIDSNPLSGNSSSLTNPRPRIVGGTTAQEGRYPYFVSLLNQHGQRACGGVLVAPDVVMTAAHCSNLEFAQIGRWSLKEELDKYEEFQVETTMYPHPLYNSGFSFANDAKLLKLNRQSTKTFININENPSLPTEASSSVRNSLTVIGFGYTQHGNTKSAPDYLQETTLSYVPNTDCERSQDPKSPDTYQGLISDSMLCASDTGKDACQGDSGGPLIVRRGSPEDDILVGIVSWGYGCAHPYYPGVFSRVSSFSGWAKMTVCEISSNPPPEYDCGNVAALPTEDDSVPITIIIQLDDHPTETAWSIIRKETNTVLVNVVQGTYTVAQKTMHETVFLPPGSNIFFRILDEHGDGLCCDTPGNYRVVLGRDAKGKVLVSGGGDFGSERWHEFQVPQDFKDRPEVPDISHGQIPLTVVIQLDEYPQEIGWRIDRLDIHNEEIIRIPAGVYVTPEMIVVRTIVLQEKEVFNFKVFDMTGDGIEGGNVQLFLGTTDIFDYSRMIFQSDGKFQDEIDHTFMASLESFPSTLSLLPDQTYLTLELRMDLYPGEIAVQLRMSGEYDSIGRQDGKAKTVIFFRPPGFYSNRVGETFLEHIPIPDIVSGASRHFVFIITDRYEDGLCCSWKESTQTGYTLYKGDPSEGNVVVTSKFESTGKEVKEFTIHGQDAPPEDFGSDETPLQNLEIKVTIALDTYPDETGFYIEDFLNRRVVDVPPGTYKDEQIIEEIITLEVGLYTFTLLDTFGDGINRDDSFFRLELANIEGRLPLISGTGAFAFQETRVFLVEGDSAKYPMFIRTPIGNYKLRFDVFRLDLVQSDALIASRGTGEADDVMEHMIEVTEGSLYRVVFDNDGEDLDGSIEINLGTSNPAVFKGLEYVVRPDTTSNPRRWQVKFFAGQSILKDESEDFEILTLRLKFDRFPSEVEWMLLSNDEPDSILGRGLKKRDLFAFGPETYYHQSLEGRTIAETIRIPRLRGDRGYTLVLTDSGNDGICCSFGDGGPVELFLGEADTGQLLFNESFQTGRLQKDFVLTGIAPTSPSSTMNSAFALTSALLVLIFV